LNVLEIRDEKDVVVVSFKHAKVLDETVIRQISAEFAKLTLEAAAERKLLLSFEKVTFMSSAMIGQIMLLNKQCKKDRIDLRLCSICANIMEIFKLMKLTKVLQIYDDEPRALASFGAPRKSWRQST